MPKITLKSKDEFPEGLREKVTDNGDGTFTVDVVPAEFRERNISLAREKDALASVLGKFKEVVGHEDIEKFSTEFGELRQTAQQVKDGKLTKKDEIDAEVARRTAESKTTLEAQIREAANGRAQEKARGDRFEAMFKASVVDSSITQAVMAADSGVNPAALPDILGRARGVFRVKEDGTLVAMQGDNILYGEDGETSMQPKEWLKKVLKESPYFGKSSTGGGATGDSKGVAGTGLSEDAWSKLSPQERLTRARQAGRKG